MRRLRVAIGPLQLGRATLATIRIDYYVLLASQGNPALGAAKVLDVPNFAWFWSKVGETLVSSSDWRASEQELKSN